MTVDFFPQVLRVMLFLIGVLECATLISNKIVTLFHQILNYF